MSISRAKTKHLRATASKKGRRESGVFTAEGVRVLEEAVRARTMPAEVYYAPSQLNDRGRSLIGTFERFGVSCQEIRASELEKLSNTRAPQGIVALFPAHRAPLSESFAAGSRRLLWCDGISDPGNLGTLIRSAAAFGFGPIVVSGASADPYNPKVVRGTAGALFGLKISHAEPDAMLRELAARKWTLIATDIEGEEAPLIVPSLKGRTVVLAVGSEARGLSEQILAAADHRIRIPHEPKVESLNAAVAGSILMKDIYEVLR